VIPVSQTVTVLFTDIVGSTDLAAQLDPERADRLRQAHFSLLRQALAHAGGTEVKNLGDGLMVVFPSPSAAVACGVAMQQAVDKENRRQSLSVGLRVGISCGEVSVEEGDYFGDPVIEAARVCAVCEGGQILVTDAVRSMAGRRSQHPFRPAGEHELKGLPDPVTVCQVDWEPDSVAVDVPLPDRLVGASAGLSGFVGRRTEHQRLVQAVKSTGDGASRVLFLAGEPGIGKTSLCREVASEVHGGGVIVLYGRCDEDLGQPYQPFAEALRHLVVHADDDLLSELATNDGGALLGLVPALGQRLPELTGSPGADPDNERFRLFSAVVGLLSAASARDGLLLVLDDLHWADRATLQLMRHLASSTQLTGVTMLVTYRDSELSAGDALSDTLATVGRESTTERVHLVGLDDVEIIEMMEMVAGHDMDDDGIGLAHAVRRETEGNPFFTTEMLRHLGETGLVHQDETGRWVASADLSQQSLPQSVRQVVGQRVDRLGEDMRRVLSYAAVIGRDFDIDVLAAVGEFDEDQALDLIDAAIEAGLLTEVQGSVGQFSFAHGLTQHTLYQDLGATRRARIHRRVADSLEQLYGDSPESRAGELANHFLAATKAADITKALGYSKMAGTQALAQQAPSDALAWFRQALELLSQIPDDDALRCDLLIGLGTAQRQVGDPAHRETLLEAAALARNTGDVDRLVAAALANSRGGASASGQVDVERIAVLERALGMIDPADSSERALLLATLCGELTWTADSDRRIAVREEALGMARRLGAPNTLMRTTLLIYDNDYAPLDLAAGVADLEQILTLAVSSGDRLAEFKAHQLLATLALERGDRERLDAHLDRAEDLSDRIDQPYLRWSMTIYRSTVTLLDCEFDRARELAGLALELGADSVPEAMATFGAQMESISCLQCDRDEIAAMTELFAAAQAELPGLPVLRAALARLYCELDRTDDAVDLIAEDVATGFERFPLDVTWVSAMCVLSDVCVRVEDRHAARMLHDRLTPYADHVATVQASVSGPVALHLGELAGLLDDADPESHFAPSLEISRRLRAPYWIARTQVAWAAALLRRGSGADTARARSMVADAVDLAGRHGIGSILSQVRRSGLDSG